MRPRLVEPINSYISRINSNESMSHEFLEECLPVLESYECWTQIFRAISKSLLTASRPQRIVYLTALARIQNQCLEDTLSAAETCIRIVEDTELEFRQFAEEILPKIISVEESHLSEVTILSSVESRFGKKSDRILCLERICFLLEKKVHSESNLAEAYERLITLDPMNSKALKYFKIVYTQNCEWEEVVGILHSLVTRTVRPQEKFRYSHELASVYLYQLDMPDEAIAIVDSQCSESPLDTSSLLYDAYHRLGNTSGCLCVLRECLLNVNDDTSRSVIHLKMAILQEQSGDVDQALENYTVSMKLNPTFLDPVEGLLNIAINKREWQKILHFLNYLFDRVQDESRRAQVRNVINRLQNGIAHAQAVESGTLQN